MILFLVTKWCCLPHGCIIVGVGLISTVATLFDASDSFSKTSGFLNGIPGASRFSQSINALML